MKQSSFRTAFRRALVRAAVAALAAACAGSAAAQSTPATAPSAQGPPQAAVVDPFNRTTPSSAAIHFVRAAAAHNYERAAAYLQLPRNLRGKGSETARMLEEVLNRGFLGDLARASRDPMGSQDDRLPPEMERLGRVFTSGGEFDLTLTRVIDPEYGPIWLFSEATVALVPEMYEQLGYHIADLVPEYLKGSRFLALEPWQWIGLAGLVPVAVALGWLITRAAMAAARGALRAANRPGAAEAIRTIGRPLWLLVTTPIFHLGAVLIGLPLVSRTAIAFAETIVAVLAAMSVGLRLVDLAVEGTRQRMTGQGLVADWGVVGLGRRVAKIVVVSLAVITLLAFFGVNITALVAGLGIGGIALALAAQKTVENIFGGVSIVLDQPVKVGDFCRLGAETGTVEDIGLRSTRIRTIGRTIVSIPNAAFSTSQIENLSRREKILFQTTVALRYETTPDQMRYVLLELRKLLLANAMVEAENVRVRFVRLGSSSLDVEVFAYVLTDQYVTFLAVQEDLLLRIMEVVREAGTGFAFPSQVEYHASDVGPDRARTEEVERMVREMRARGELPAPDVPAGSAAATRGDPPHAG